MAMLKPRCGGWGGTYSCPAIVTFPDMLGASYVEIPTVVSMAVADSLDGKINIIWGISVDDSLGDGIRVCLWMAK